MSETGTSEGALAEALADVGSSDAEVRRRVDGLPREARFTHLARWLELGKDERLPAWRRVAAVGIALSHCLSYPIDRASFVRQALAPFGLANATWVDMTIAQHVPLERRDDAVIRMIHLPIETAVGPAAVYISLLEPNDSIEQAAISPDLDRSGAP